MDRPKLYMMCGISGCGKTTYAKKFAREHEVLYLNPDKFYELFNGDERRHYHEFEIWMALFRALHMAMKDGTSVIFDTNSPTYVGRSQILDWFPDFEPHLIYIEASEELCRSNNAARRRVIPENEMHNMILAFQPPRVGEDDRWQTMTFLQNIDNTIRPHVRYEKSGEGYRAHLYEEEPSKEEAP